ncbi:MAG: hypothetical protein HQM04_17830 [Magnetococcales bacterium]|nr:hypothetical protein [Magnetococcales bacterium]MBF0116890.1 hypothetical protein [Magnetococcales bacterium]
MSIAINTNAASIGTQRNLLTATNRLSTAFERLGSGKRINRAADDAAGMSISTRMNSQIRGFNQALRNVNDAISLSQVATGALGDVQGILQRMRELAVQAANDTNTMSDRQDLQAEFDQLRNQISQIASNVDFNGTKLLDGSFSGKTFHVSSNQTQTVTIDSVMGVKPSVLGGTSTETVVTGGVEPGWTKYGNSLYKVISTNTWDIAEVEAENEGGHLVEINDAAENAFILSQFGGVKSKWIGLTDAAAEGHWVWSNGDLITYQNWHAGEPNGGTVENAGVMYVNYPLAGVINGTWGDWTSNVPFPDADGSIIEKPYSPPAGSIVTTAEKNLSDAIITTAIDAEGAISIIDRSINDVAGMASSFGSFQNRMDSISQDLMVMSQNTAGARSRIEDADYTAETANMAKNSIVQQAANAILAQANQQPNIVMQLLK